MVKRKLKILNAPAFWKAAKKKTTWVVSPSPGPHKKFENIPLSILLRNVLKFAETLKEARSIIKQGKVLINNKIVRDEAFPIGLLDTVSIPKVKKYYRVVPVKKGLVPVEIDEKESNIKICRIRDKTILKKGKVQLNLNDGRNILAAADGYSTGDSLLIELPSLKIIKHLKLKPGASGIVVKGTDSGKTGKVKSIMQGSMSQPSKVVCDLGGSTKEVLKDRFFVLGDDRPMISVSGTDEK